MILVPMLVTLVKLPEKEVFPTSLSIILPICAVSVLFTLKDTTPDWQNFLPYMAGGVIGGAAAGLIGQKIPVKWLHRLLGILIIWGGIQNLCF